jgi:hypothetical protein
VILEAEFGEALRWERLDAKRASRVACYVAGSIEDPADVVEKHQQWAIDHLLRFKKVFGPRLAKLSSDTQPGVPSQ